MNIKTTTWNKTRTPTEKELKNMFTKEGKKYYTYVMEREEFVESHSHNYDETRILLEGKVEIAAEGRTFILKPGDRIDIKKGTTHTAKNLDKTQSVMLCGN